MPGLFVGVLLLASLLLAHFSMRSQPMPSRYPLNVDVGLPLPEAGQASTVFSLTALFGAYFGIYLVLGAPALVGLAFGSALGLFLIRQWITSRQASTFENFLLEILPEHKTNAGVFALVLMGIQGCYATSELLILRETAKAVLGLRADQATLLAIALALIGYFYVLFGGYMAVFRTDVLQFVLVAFMALALCALLLLHGMPTGWTAELRPRPGYWELPGLHVGPLLYVYHFLIGAVMGLGLLAASPDTWKRVFIVAKFRQQTLPRFLLFLSAGIAPFLVLLVLGIPTARIPDGPVSFGLVLSGMLSGSMIFVAAALGLVSSFLSSFDSALLATVQLGLILNRKKAPVENETQRFHWLMAVALLMVFCLFMALRGSNNPYLVGNLLLGAYAVVTGIELGTSGAPARLPENSLLWVLVVGLVGWFLFVVSTVGLPDIPTTYQVNTVPGGVLLCVIAAVVCRLLLIGGRGRGSHH